MKFKVSCGEFHALGTRVLKGAVRNSYSRVAMKLDEDKTLTLCCYSDSTYFKGTIKATDVVDADGLWKKVDPSYLRSVLSIIPADSDENISFVSDKFNMNFTLTFLSKKVALNTEDGGLITEGEPTTTIADVDANSFMDTLSSVLEVVENDPSGAGGPTTCLHLFFKDDECVFMGTNRIAIAEVKYPIENKLDEEKTFLLKRSEANLLTRAFEANEIIELVKTDTKFGFIDSEGTISLVGIMNEIPIEYSAVKTAAGGDMAMTIETSSFKHAINDINKISGPQGSAQFLQKGNNLKLTNSIDDAFGVIVEMDEGTVVDFSADRAALLSVIDLLGKAFQMTWDEATNKNGGVLSLQPYSDDEEDELIENVFIGIATDEK